MPDSSPPRFADLDAWMQRRTGHSVALGMRLVDHGEDWVDLALDYDRRLISDLETGILASGPVVSLIDSASGMAVRLRSGRNPQGTLDLRVDYLRPARPGHTVIAHAECYRVTRRIAFTRAFAHDGDPSEPLAHAAGTFVLEDAE